MRAVEWLTLGGLEIANMNRTLVYVRNLGDARFGISLSDALADRYDAAALSCYCSVVDEGPYLDPATDDAPWYDAAKPESEEFLGIWAHSITVDPVLGRDVNQVVGEGAVLSPIRASHRTVAVEGLMIANTARGMAFGERWLTEALRGSFCLDGCAADDLCILPACPPDDDPNPDRHIRTLRQAGLIDGPNFLSRTSIAECVMQSTVFQLVAARPPMFAPEETCLDEQVVTPGSPAACMASTDSWPGNATLDIRIEVTAASDNIRIRGQTSLDGNCPPEGNFASAALCFDYLIPDPVLNGVYEVQGTQRRVIYADPSLKISRSGLSHIEFEGPWRWPDIPPCTDMCIMVSVGSGSVKATVGKSDMEL